MNPFTDSGAKGAASELIACAHFLKQGYYVYRSEGQHAPFDLVVYKGGALLRVEVKSVSIQVNASTGARSCTFARPKNEEYDLLAVVIDDHVIVFERGSLMTDCMAAVRQVVAAMPDQGHWGEDSRSQRSRGHSGRHVKPIVEIE